MRYSGQVAPFYPSTAPLELRLPQAVYDESSPSGPTSTGPGISMLGDIDSGWGDVQSTIPLLPGRPLKAMRSPVSTVRPAPAVPSWVRTNDLLALQGCNCAPSPMSGFDAGSVLKNALLGGAGGAVYGMWSKKNIKKQAIYGALVGAALSLIK